MFYAKAMYLGGAIIFAANENFDYSSYKILGLRCLECGKEVYLKRGKFRKSHFAHPENSDISNNCSLRTNNSSKYSDSWNSFTYEGKGQRLKLFQEYFLDIFRSQNYNFDLYVEYIKHEIPFNALEAITYDCIQWFYENKHNLVIECRELSLDNYKINMAMRFLIASEAIDYLSLESSSTLLENLICFSIYVCCFKSQFFKLNEFISNKYHSSIYETIKNVFNKTDWVIAFNCLEDSIQLAPIYPQIDVNLLKNLANFLEFEDNYLEFQYKSSKAYKLKLKELNVGLYDCFIIPERGYRRNVLLKKVGSIVNINLDSNSELFIFWELIYHKDLSKDYPNLLDFYKYLSTEIVKFLTLKQINKVNFTLVNWEEIEELEKQRTEAEYLIKNIRQLKEQESKKQQEESRNRLQRRIDREIALQKKWDERVNNFETGLSSQKFLYEEFIQLNEKHYNDAMAMIQCPICEQLLKHKNLLSHINKTHFPKAKLHKLSGI